MLSARASASEQQSSSPTAVPEAGAPLFHAVSPMWMLDGSIPIEVRTLVMVLYALSFQETVAQNESYKTFGLTPVSVATSYDEIGRHTGWNRTRIAEVVRAAEAMRILRLTGNNRVGVRYHVLLSLRTYTPGFIPDKATTPLFASDRTVLRRRKQLALGETLSPATGLNPDTAFSPATGTKETTLSPAIGLNNEISSPATRTEDASPSPAIGLNNTRSKERVRDHRVTHRDIPKDSNRGALAPDIYNALLQLGKKTDPSLEPGNVIFEGAVTEMLDHLNERFEGEENLILSRLVADPRVAKAHSPIAFLRRGITGGFLLAPAALAKPEAHSPEAAYTALPPGQQEALMMALEGSRATLAWCRERDIPPAALQHARILCERRQGEHVDNEVSPVAHFPSLLENAVENAYQQRAIPDMLYFSCRTIQATLCGDHIEVLAPNAFLADMLRARLLPVLEKSLHLPISLSVSP